jgi:UDP-glucose 4-epimerase
MTDDLRHKTVLVTGAAGFLGRHAARAFAAHGARVLGLGHGPFMDAKAWGLAQWHEGPLTSEALSAISPVPDIVVHCAGSSAVGRSFEAPHEDFLRTAATTSLLLDHLRLGAPEARFIYPSSAAAYGMVENVPIGIQEPLQPVSPYGAHKIAAEGLCRSHGRHFGRRGIIIRFFSLYGPGLRKQLLWDACRKLSAGTALFSGTGMERRDWLFIEDAAELIVAAAHGASTDMPVINGGTGVGATVQEAVGVLADVIAPQTRIVFDGRARPGDPPVYVADITEAAALGWRPKTSHAEGMRRYAEWYRDGGGA